MTKSPDHGALMIDATALPVALREPDMASAESDVRHLSQLIAAALDRVIVLQVDHPAKRQDLERATAFLWVARDLAELLEWKLERMQMQIAAG